MYQTRPGWPPLAWLRLPAAVALLSRSAFLLAILLPCLLVWSARCVAQQPAALPPLPALTVAADTPIEVRLTHRISTSKGRKGFPVEAVLSAPVVQDGVVVLPEGTELNGLVSEVDRVGLGFHHETAAIGLEIDTLVLPNGGLLKIATKVAQIENSRETVSPKTGKIQGVRSTSTLSHKLSGAVGTLAFSNPIALIFTTAGSASILRFSDPEISLPANTELMLKLTAPVTISHPVRTEEPLVASSPEAQTALRALVRRQPFRTVTDKAHTPSDITNLMFIGSNEAILRAFAAAGWLQVSSLSADSTYKTIRSITEMQAYRTAPMSTLLLENRPPVDSLAKTLDTFSKRHHLRVFATGDTWEGQPVWVSSSTQDIGIGFSAGKKTFIHQIDHNVDHERNKAVNDLLLTGCVTGINLVERTWLPKDLMNGTGEPIVTDDRMAVLRLNDCGKPAFVAAVSETDATPLHANIPTKVTRQTVLTLRDMVTRDNVGVSAYGIVHNIQAARHPRPPEAPLVPASEITLARYAIGVPLDEPDTPTLRERTAADTTVGIRAPVRAPVDKYAAPTIEFGVHAGRAGYKGGNGGYVGYLFVDPTDPTADPAIDVLFDNKHHAGYTLGASVTLDSNRYFSHEISFDYNRTGFDLNFYDFSGLSDDASVEADYELQPSMLSTTEVSYNLLLHMRPKGKRLRPYFMLGPSFRLMHMTDAPIKKASPYFKLGLSTVGSISAAYEFGTTPVLDGGGLFQFGFQYGAGVQYRLARRWMWRLDYKETLSAQPDFFSKSVDDIFDTSDLPGYELEIDGPDSFGKMRQQRVTSGFAFVF